MAVNTNLFNRLLHGGVGHGAALALADPAEDGVSGVAVADAAALTGTDVAAATPAASPAGGTGAAAGGFDTAGNRDLAIATINGTRTLADETKTDFNALRADVTALRTQLNAALASLRTAGVIAP